MPRRFHVAVVFFALLAALAGPVRAQSATESDLAGARVRATIAGQPREFRNITGALVGFDDTLAIRTDTGLIQTPRDRVQRLERMVGTRSRGANIARGALIGGGIGFAAGFAIGYADGDDMFLEAEEKAMIGGAELGAVGALFGLVFGSLMDRAIWESLDVERTRVEFAWRQDTFAMTVRVASP